MARAYNDNNDGGWMLTRILQVLTLIPCWCVLAIVISNYNTHSQLTPASIQFLFAIILILSIWSFCLIITYLRARNTALWMAFFDVVGMVCLIAAVIWLSNITNVECLQVYMVVNGPSTSSNSATTTVIGYPYSGDPGTKVNGNNSKLRPRSPLGFLEQLALAKRQTYVDANGNVVQNPPLYLSQCGLIKAAWGLAIANIILFFISAIVSTVLYWEYNVVGTVVKEQVVVEPSAPAVGMAQQPPLHMDEGAFYGGSSYAGGRRYSRRDSEGGRGERRHNHHSRRHSRADSEYYV